MPACVPATHEEPNEIDARPPIAVRRSSIHGRGVFALAPIEAGRVLFDYGGEVITAEEADARYEQRGAEAGHTFYFDLGDGRVIDGGSDGNDARWINHSCEPNCAAEVDGLRVTITTLRDIEPGEELSLDYQLVIDLDTADEDDLTAYACRCGAPSCRSTMLRIAEAS